MPATGRAMRLSVYVGEDDVRHHSRVYHEVVRRARKAGLAGATVLRGIEGYGATSRIHTDRMLDLTEGLPVVVIIVDAEDRIRAFLPQLDDLVTEGLVTVEHVEVVHNAGRPVS